MTDLDPQRVAACVDPRGFTTCFDIARAHGWTVPVDADDRVTVWHAGRLIELDAQMPIGRMLLAAHRHLGAEGRREWHAVAHRMLLLFELLIGHDDALSGWVHVDREGFRVSSSLLAAAALTRLVPTPEGTYRFDLEALRQIAQRFDFDASPLLAPEADRAA